MQAAIGPRMSRRQSPLPRNHPKLWLMTDARFGDALLPSIAALPTGAGIIFRHYDRSLTERQALFDAVRVIARRRRLLLVCAGPRLKGARLFHGRRTGDFTAPAHSIAERIAAERRGAALVFYSPIFATRSHPGASQLGRVRFGLAVRSAKAPIIALGGMTPKRARSLEGLGAYGWAGIDGLMISTKAKT